MARVLCIDDFPLYAEMVGTMLTRVGGHEVRCMVAPILLQEIVEFAPDVIVLNLVRKLESISAGGMHDFYTDVEGAQAFRALSLAESEGGLDWPIIVTALAVLEHELPQTDGLRYEAFIEVPQKLERLCNTIDKVVAARMSGVGLVSD